MELCALFTQENWFIEENSNTSIYLSCGKSKNQTNIENKMHYLTLRRMLASMRKSRISAVLFFLLCDGWHFHRHSNLVPSFSNVQDIWKNNNNKEIQFFEIIYEASNRDLWWFNNIKNHNTTQLNQKKMCLS